MPDFVEKLIQVYEQERQKLENEAYQKYEHYVGLIAVDAQGKKLTHNNDVDAFRHAYTAGSLTMDWSNITQQNLLSENYEIPSWVLSDLGVNVAGLGVEVISSGEFLTKNITKINTAEFWQQLDGRRKESGMDVHNNWVGSNLSVGVFSKDQLAQKIANAIQTGDLITEPNTPFQLGEKYGTDLGSQIAGQIWAKKYGNYSGSQVAGQIWGEIFGSELGSEIANSILKKDTNIQSFLYQDLLPLPGIYIESHPVGAAPFKEHLYLVYRYVDKSGNLQEKIIRGGPARGIPFNQLNEKLDVEVDILLKDSTDSYKPGETLISRHSTRIDLPPGKDAATVWSEMIKVAEKIRQGNYDYDLLQNSNTVIRTVLDGSNFDADILLPKYLQNSDTITGDVFKETAPGFDNITSKMYSEVMGAIWGEKLGNQAGQDLSSQMLNINVNPSGSSSDHSSVDTSNGWQNGTVTAHGNWSVYMKPEILNSDGLRNVWPSYMVSNGFRPGAQDFSKFSLR